MNISTKKRRPLVAVLIRPELRRAVIAPDAMQRLRRVARVRQVANDDWKNCLRDADACITSWGSPPLEAELLAVAPDLQFAAHAAGSVKPIVTKDLWRRRIRVSSAAAAIAVEVVQYTYALMILGAKRIWEVNQRVRDGQWGETRGLPRELCGLSVGIVGAGVVGRGVLELLKQFPPKRVLLFDPFVSAAQSKRIGAIKSSLDTLLRRADIISLHAPSLPQTRHLLDARRLRLIRDGAQLINTARGTLIDEFALARELETKRFFACLDVTDPEPPARNHPFRKLPNVLLTPHMAGCVADGRARMGALAVEELIRYFSGKRLHHEVRQKDLLRRG